GLAGTGPTFTLMPPRQVRSSICSAIDAPGTQAATWTGSIRSAQTFSTGAPTNTVCSIFKAICPHPTRAVVDCSLRLFVCRGPSDVNAAKLDTAGATLLKCCTTVPQAT